VCGSRARSSAEDRKSGLVPSSSYWGCGAFFVSGDPCRRFGVIPFQAVIGSSPDPLFVYAYRSHNCQTTAAGQGLKVVGRGTLARHRIWTRDSAVLFIQDC